MVNKDGFIHKNLGIIITLIVQFVLIISFFVKMDSRVQGLEKWRDEINPQRVNIKDINLLEEKIKNLNSNLLEIKSDLKEIKREMKI